MKNKTRASRLIKAIDPYLPPSFRESTNLSLEELIRARVLVSIMLSAMISVVFSMIVMGISDKASGSDFSNPLMMAAISGVVIVFDYVFFYKSGRLDASAILFSFSLFLATVVSIILTGGFDSPVRIMLICIPVIAFLVGGRQEGMYNAALSYVVGIVLLLLRVYDFPMMQVLPDSVLPYLSGIIWLLAILVIVVCLYVYDVLLEETRDTIADISQANEASS